MTNYYYFYTTEDAAANPGMTAGVMAVSVQLQLPSWTDETVIREYTFGENGVAQEGNIVPPEATETPEAVHMPDDMAGEEENVTEEAEVLEILP